MPYNFLVVPKIRVTIILKNTSSTKYYWLYIYFTYRSNTVISTVPIYIIVYWLPILFQHRLFIFESVMFLYEFMLCLQ